MGEVRVPGFLPSVSGFSFPNDFPNVPMVELPIPGMPVKLGDASNGLCGGMSFAAADLFASGRPPPPDEIPPSSGPLFQFLVKRAIDSFDLPDGPLKYLLWMGLPDQDALFGIHGLAWRTMTQEWPALKADLDAGKPSPLGLVRTRSFNPKDLGLNHQVLAYGYDEGAGPAAPSRVLVYDPNYPGDDAVAITVTTGDPAGRSTFAYVAGDHPVRGFFRSGYRPADPSSIAGPAPGGSVQ